MTHPYTCYLTGIVHVNDKVQEKVGNKEADFKTILNHLESVYCGKIAYEFMHLPVKYITHLLLSNNSNPVYIVYQRKKMVVSCCRKLGQD